MLHLIEEVETSKYEVKSMDLEVLRSQDLPFWDPSRSGDPLRSRVGTPNGPLWTPYWTPPHGVRGAHTPCI